MYGMVKKQVKREHEEEVHLVNVANAAKRRSKMMTFLATVLGSSLIFIVGVMSASMYGLIQVTKESVMSGTSLAVKGTADIVGTAAALVDIPLFAAPALDQATPSLMGSVKTVSFHYELVVNGTFSNGWIDNTTFIQPDGDITMDVVKTNKINETWVDFYGPEGVKLSVKNGKVKYYDEDKVEYHVCSGNTACAAIKVPSNEAEDLKAIANASLIEQGFIVPARRRLSEADKAKIEEYGQERRRLQQWWQPNVLQQAPVSYSFIVTFSTDDVHTDPTITGHVGRVDECINAIAAQAGVKPLSKGRGLECDEDGECTCPHEHRQTCEQVAWQPNYDAWKTRIKKPLHHIPWGR